MGKRVTTIPATLNLYDSVKIHKKEKLQDTPEFPKILKSRQRVMLLKLITILRILKKIRNGNLLVYILTKV